MARARGEPSLARYEQGLGAGKPVCCACGAPTVATEDLQEEGLYVMVDRRCDTCEHRWHDVFEFQRSVGK